MSLPPLPTTPAPERLRVVVLTCGNLGLECGAALARVPNVEVLAVVRAPELRQRSVAKRLKLLYRRQGVGGLARSGLRRVGALARRLGRAIGVGHARPGLTNDGSSVRVLDVEPFGSAATTATLKQLAPDLGVVYGTGILREETFGIPRFGCVNMHCGRLPDYKGAPPGFWELYEGEAVVGVTIHRVTAKLDAGPILAQEVVALDPAPAGDVMAYVNGLWRDVLRPVGLRLLADVCTAVAAGAAVGRAQGPTTHPVYKFPDRHTVRELRQRVRARRRNVAVR